MLCGNKGEWSEVYCFAYLLATGKLYAADKDLNTVKDVYFPILKILRENHAYATCETVKIFYNDTLVKEVGRAEFKRACDIMLEKIPKGSRAFEIKEVEPFLTDIFCSKLKAASDQKQDITIQIYDIHTGISPICGFSIKSYLGARPTLLNPGDATNFIYEIKNCNDAIMNNVNAINSRSKIIDRINYLYNSDCVLSPEEHLYSRQFEENLGFVDTSMPKMLSLLTLYSYMHNIHYIPLTVEKIKADNPLMLPNSNMYEYKFKKLLCAFALGMTPENKWEGQEDANGGYIIVKNDGSVVCYHIYNRPDFEQYLYDYSYIERPSTSRYGYASVYSDNGKYYIKLNLQVRFK